jgi:membrane associated rhomboid family serine protease
MSTVPTALPQPPRRTSQSKTQRRVKQARTFFIITVLAALVSVAGHCLTGDEAAPVANAPTQITAQR